ncbi:alpha/beta hydrolase [Amycolatopsis sp. lyj-23]|uniref:alpha/beta hydrolase n=1 Tax=Amycolatopsis sp. lyj-23 TaxID=2789283 RepID=UPI00397B540F
MFGTNKPPWGVDLLGRVDRHWIASECLRPNLLGDPHERPMWVYVPPGYDDDARSYPTIYVIQGYTGYLTMWENRTPFRHSYLENVDALFRDGSVPSCLVVLVDTWTSYGGSQFVDSAGTGAYHSYLCDEVVPWIDGHYRTIVAAESRAITGKSSGGYGAMITPLLRPDLFGALASHAGDASFELPYAAEFGAATRALREYDADITRWWADFTPPGRFGRQVEDELGAAGEGGVGDRRALVRFAVDVSPRTYTDRAPFSRPHDGMLLELWGVAACFSPGPDGRPQLPFDQRTGAIIPDIWQRWLDRDPVRMAARHTDAVRNLGSVWLDAGDRDDYYLDLAALEFAAALRRAGLAEDRIHCEVFEGTHAGIDHRYPLALRWLAERLPR